MCGVFALAGKNQPIDMELFFNGLTLMRHRGPDGFGVQSFNASRRDFKRQLNPNRTSIQNWNHGANLVLGHRRLSILDISERAAQPMRSASGRYFITYNGELYNYKELKNQL